MGKLPTWRVRKAGFMIYTRERSDAGDTLLIEAATKEEAIAEYKRRAGITKTKDEPTAVMIDAGEPATKK